MFTDMVGYSSMIQENEALGLELLEEHRTIVRSILPKHEGREIDTAGDAFFAEFGSALGATECAIEIQQAFHERNLEHDEAHWIILRIGLHLGDVVHQGNQVQGDGVNIAARMEPLARPGSICLSEDVARQVHNKIPYPIVPIGDRRLKNIRLPMVPFRVIMPWEEDFETADPFHSFKRDDESASPRQQESKNRLRWAGALALALVVIGVVWMVQSLQPKQNGENGGDLPASVVAVLPFSVQGSPDMAYLGAGMVDLLSTKLDGVGEIRAVDPRAVLGIVEQAREENIDPASGRQIADRLGAGSFVLGNIVEIGGRLRISAAVYPPMSSIPTEQGSSDGEAEGIFDLVDELAAQLVTVDDRGPGASIDGIEDRTTSSFAALKHYLSGIRAFRAARFQLAADELTQAVELDSTFALAWYQLSATAEWLFDADLIVSAAEQARKYSDRLPDRSRRLVEALYTGKLGRNREALRLYRELLASYPDDVEGWYQLAELQFHTGPSIGSSPQESLPAWERLVYFEPDQVTALIHMARIYAVLDMPAMVDSVAGRVLELEPEAERNVELLSLMAAVQDTDEIPPRLDARLRAASDDMLLEAIWSLAAFRPSHAYASAVIPYVINPSRSSVARQFGHLMQAYLYMAEGRAEASGRALDRAEASGFQATDVHRAMMTVLPYRNPDRDELERLISRLEAWDASAIPPSGTVSSWFAAHDQIHEELRLYVIGLVSAQLGDHGRALDAAASLEAKQVSKPLGSLPSDLALGVRAEVARIRGDDEIALDLLMSRAHNVWYQYMVNSTFASQARERFVEAQLLIEDDQESEALHELGLFVGYSLYDWIYVAPSHLERARALEAAGETDQSAKHYARFIELWEGADAEFLPELERAQERLAQIR